MPLHQWLDPGRIGILDAPGDRDAVIDAVARLLADPAAADGEAIRQSLQARERLASTGIGHGVAFPHGRVASLEHTRGAFLRLARPVDFGAVDGEPVDLVLAMAVPEHALQEHLQQLAELAERFGDPDFRRELRHAGDAEALRRSLLEAPAAIRTPQAGSR
jgi:PTS system nitrogen regulatory IIA component